MRRIALFSIVLITSLFLFNACKKNNNPPPDLLFREGLIVTAGGDTARFLADGDTVHVGQRVVIGSKANKTEDNLERFNLSYMKADTSVSQLYYSKVLERHEYKEYHNAIFFTVQNILGKVTWRSQIIDDDGNKAEIKMTLTVL